MKNISEKTRSFNRGKQLYQSGKLKEACDCFTQAIGVEPYHGEALFFLGMIAIQGGQPQKALKFFLHAKRHPQTSINLQRQIRYYLKFLGWTSETQQSFLYSCQNFEHSQAFLADEENIRPKGPDKFATKASEAHIGRNFEKITIIVCSTDDNRFQNLKDNIDSSFSIPVQLLRIKDALSLAEGYNRGLRLATGDIIIICRDDIEILNKDLDKILIEDLVQFDIVGVLGTSRLVAENWSCVGQPFIHGQIGCKDQIKPESHLGLMIYGLGRDPKVVENIQALTGGFFAAKKNLFSKLRFDETISYRGGLSDLDFTFSAYLQGFKLSIDHRIMLIAHTDQEYVGAGEGDDSPFIVKHSKAIEKLNAQCDRILCGTGEKVDVCIKKMLPPSKKVLKQIMQNYGGLKRVNLKCAKPDFKEFDNISVVTLDIRSGLSYGDNSISYLRIEDAKSFYSHKVRWMKEFLRVCGQGAILEINMGWHREMGVERKTLWKYHDFNRFDLNSPGYYKYSEIDAADGAFLLKRIASRANGNKRGLTAIYQVVKDRANIEWLKAQQKLPQRESVIGHRPKDDEPKFSIIIPHYQGSIGHEYFLRGIRSILDQTFKDFEILCYHDGPLLDAALDFPVKIFPTAKRYNDWGHSLRDIGIYEAKGEYIIHFNPDNILYPQALERLSSGCKEILVFPLIMMGMERDGDLVFQHKQRSNHQKMMLTGNPVVYGGIDCMQFVMKRDKWIECGGWFDKRGNADGFMYPLFAEKYDVEFIGNEALGEHW